ncbi:group I intron-associated PD-(D/E)XK endonuclease [Egicoccus sp. AB-alg6-2]|uniref:group I intron-associated PD-(D/E)XK endonuclease n=1 Tax=Egicoccus sp. AB-alg6-2 TaxID=3242692 RepID=UPI00359DF125
MPDQPQLVSDDHAATGQSDGAAAHLAKRDRRPADTIWRANPREQGLIGVTDAIGWFGRRGWSLSVPLIDSQPYDLVVDDGERLHRVQVKTTTYRTRYGVYVVSLATRGGNQSFHTSKPFDHAAVDLLYVLAEGRSRYLIPSGAFRSRTTLNLGTSMAAYQL